ncbi:T9SS type A sorting domain-containing protein [Aequorivita xiaoshiensis]|uniref:T9SS type A sorting domain-containing protein n=1 Tax=Aequorivita xiaoshiensis TaxID=2874476 RepID=A0A9X1QZQ3_9FLAO|nr:T9SS type A sorting domain-containing protein [Aequorivita xiaoshiensis]MCG2430878.1 T9SS type A sorting domain-containing protein [Aequorivita xiaoshiensis]
MKKITLLASALLMTAATFGQNLIIERIQDNNTGLISTKGDDGTGVYCADYFSVTSDVALGELTLYGLNNASATPIEPFVTGFNVYLYEISGAVPAGNPEVAGSGILELGDIDPSLYTITEDGQNTDFTVNITDANGGNQVVLEAGNIYWLSVFPSVEGGPDGDGRWNWFGSLSSFPNEEPVLIDPSDIFGAGATDWTNIAGLIGEPFPSFAWNLTDEPIASIGDNLAEMIAVYPNPTTDVLNLNIPSNIEVTNVAMYDVLGKNVGAVYSNGTINTSSFAQGVYTLKVETTSGTLTQKVVKQ